MTRLQHAVALALAAALAAMPLAAAAKTQNSGGGGRGGGGHAAAPHAARISAPRAATHFSTPRAINRSAWVYRGRSLHRSSIRQNRQSLRAAQIHPRKQQGAANRHARQLHAQEKQLKPNAAAKTAAATQSKAQTQAQRRAARQVNRVTARAARQGRFAAQAHAKWDAHRHAGWWARRAWRAGLLAAFVPWYGPLFWPYAYSDIFDYVFWPYGYEYGYWAFAYDDFIDGMFWGPYGPPAAYAYAPAPRRRATATAVRELCAQPGSGVTAWPFADIKRTVDLTADQKQLLGAMRAAADDAAASFKASCPANDAFPLTPPGRLEAMTARLQATLQAVQTVRPALETFYAALSDEQKERFNELGPKRTASNAEARAALPADAKACAQPKPGLTNLPIERIGDTVDPTEEQEPKLTALKDATDRAVSILQAACPDETPITPTGRLEAMETRLKAMVDAANAVKPALADFYGSLSAEQKARFNRIGREMAETND